MTAPHSNLSTNPATRVALADLCEQMFADILPDYANGLLDADPETKAMVEELLQTSADARAFLKDYRAACGSRTEAEWDALAGRILAHIHADDEVVAPAPPRMRVHSGQVLRKPQPVRQWLVGLLGELPLLTSSAFALHGNAEAVRQVWKLDLSKVGLPGDERRARVPWAGEVVQISQSKVTNGVATYFAYVEPSDDERPHGVLLITLRAPDGQRSEVRLTKRGPKKRFLNSVLPADPKSLQCEISIE